ncbi:MAG: diacylglycerol kinase family protein, partial [Chitinophagaceae bacterium]
MPNSVSRKILFVINPVSGVKSKVDWSAEIQHYFEPLHHSIELFLLEGDNNEASLIQLLKNSNFERVVAVGGDGTVSMVAKHLLGTSISLGILPAGSANGMAKELQIPEDITAALNLIVSDNIHAADVINVNGHICMHLSDIGINAQLIKYFEEGNWRGKLGYARMVVKVLRKKQNMQLTMQTKEVEVKCSAFMVVLANASKYGFGAIINPDGDLYDGLFEVIVMRKLAISEFFKMWFGPPKFNPQNIEIFHAKAVTIETTRKVHF